MQFNKQLITNFVNGTGEFIKKNSPHIFTGIAFFGVFSTAFFSVKGVLKAREILENERQRREEKLIRDCQESNLYPENDNIPPYELIQEQTKISKKDMIKLIWKPILPAVISAASTCTSIIMSDVTHSSQKAALITALTASSKALEGYQKNNIKLFGEKAHEKIVDETAKEAVETNKDLANGYIIDTGLGNTVIIDLYNGRPIMCCVDEVDKAVNRINKSIFADNGPFYYGFRSLNDFYEELNIWQDCFKPKNGEDVGWDKNHPLEIEWSSVPLDGDKPVMVFTFRNKPWAHWQLEELRP